MEITVQCLALPAKPKSTCHPANTIVAQVQQTLFEAKADFPLMYSRWATHTNNFIYVFSGNIAYYCIQQISKFLLAPFTEGILAPVGGWSRLLLNNVPTSNNISKIHT